MRAEESEFLSDNADAVVRHDDDSEQPEDPAITERQNDDEHDRGKHPVRGDEVTNGVQDGVHEGLR